MPAHLYELLCQRAVQYPAVVALGSQDGLAWKSLTSRELLDQVDRLSVELSTAGVGEGDRVVLWIPNHWRTLVYFFAIWKLGAVAVPFDREMNPEAGARILDAVEPRLVIAGYGEWPAWARQAQVTEWWEPGQRGAATAQPQEWHSPGETLAVLMFTSGTTGTPKGCMITQANLLSQVEAVSRRVPLGPTCRLASVLPLSHLLELTGELHALASGAAIHYVPSRRPRDLARVLAEQGVTHLVIVPQLMIMLGRSLEQQLTAQLPPLVWRAATLLATWLPLPVRRWLFWPLHRKLGGHLRLLLSGGAALPLETHQLWERFGVRVVQGYGTSECSPVVTLASPDGRAPATSVGRPLDGVEVRLSPDGELLVRGPNVMRGYWRDPERTSAVLRAGWYATGDLAEIDAAGYVRIVGRAKDLIALPSGLKVWPEDVEDVLRSHPAVKDAAIVAVPTPAGGARLHAYLIPAGPVPDGFDLSALVAECNGRLAAHQRLASAAWYPELDFPRTSMLKLRRHLLPDPTSLQAVAVESMLAADDPVGQAIAGLAQTRAVGPEQTLGQLGLDSLGLVDLALVLEGKTGRAVTDSDLRLEMTVQQVRAMLAAAPSLDTAPLPGHGGPEQIAAELPLWPYTWGQIFRALDFPIDLLYRWSVTRTTVLGQEHLVNLPSQVIFAGTHHAFPDMPLVRFALTHSPARHLAGRLVVPIAAGGFASGGLQLGLGLGLYPWYGILAFGLYPLRQLAERDISLRGLARLAQLGHPILIFPQGTHARPSDELTDQPAVRFRPGVGYLARTVGAAVLPFGLAGTERLMPPDPFTFTGRKIAGVPIALKRGPLAIAFGPLVQPAPDESAQNFAARLQDLCYALTRQAEDALKSELGGG